METQSLFQQLIALFLTSCFLSVAAECIANPYQSVDVVINGTSQTTTAPVSSKTLTTGPLPSVNSQLTPTNSDSSDKHIETAPKAESQNAEKLTVTESSVFKFNHEVSKTNLNELCRTTRDLDSFIELGMAYEKRGMNDEAILAYKTAISINPNKVETRLRLAEVRLLQGNEKGALDDYAEFLRLKPESPNIQIKMARILCRNNQTILAIELYKSALKQSPNEADIHRELAIIYKSNKDFENATTHFQKSIEIRKTDLESRNNLVSLYSIAKQISKLRQLLEETVELFPDDVNSHYKLAVVYDYLKEYALATEEYKKTLALKPDHIKSIAALKSVYLKTGKYQEAKDLNKTLTRLDREQLAALETLTVIGDNFDPKPNKINYSLKRSALKTAKKAKRSAKVGNKEKKIKQKADSK
ncbi:MAG: tetratricopeptide repeat protein [Desulfuromonadaceae bacterium]